MPLPAGKLPPEVLNNLLQGLPSHPSVLVGAQVGEDAAVIDNGGAELLVAKTDPITFATDDLGPYLLAVNGNDLATMGAEPRWLLVTALLPEGIEETGVQSIFGSVRDSCAEAGIALVGGHTEITVGLDRPILVGCLLGTAPRDRIIRTSGAQPADAVILTGGIAIEGAAILAREHAAELRDRGVPEEAIQAAAGWLRKPGISVLPAARILRDCETVHSMHDPTEGGLATALRELAAAAKVGLKIDTNVIPVLEECRTI
ncbi:MAG: hydrogenase expression protein, partial [bacterium]|nr:hydrogenase expression protein [bacterium]